MTVQTAQTSIIPVFSKEKLEIWKRMYCKGASDDEWEIFIATAQRTGLEPGKQIHAVPREDRKTGKTTITIQTGIDGYRLIADRTGKYMPGRETSYAYDKDGRLLSATAYVKKYGPDGQWHEVAATAFWAEYVQTYYDRSKNETVVSKFWAQMPHGMLGKCAETLALRKAFPADLSGLYTREEMAQVENEIIPGTVINKETGEVTSQIEAPSAISQSEAAPSAIQPPVISIEHLEQLSELIGDDKEIIESLKKFYKISRMIDLPEHAFEPIKRSLIKKNTVKAAEKKA